MMWLFLRVTADNEQRTTDHLLMKRKLKTGFTTGTAAAAAAKGALRCLLDDRSPTRVRVELLTGDRLAISIHRCKRVAENEARCTVIKDAGDDPDVTHKAEIGAMVRLTGPGPRKLQNRGLRCRLASRPSIPGRAR
jgi:cobalamin biosynthesis protein CbiD